MPHLEVSVDDAEAVEVVERAAHFGDIKLRVVLLEPFQPLQVEKKLPARAVLHHLTESKIKQ